MKVLKFPVGQMAANCYIVIDQKTGECCIIDPGDDSEYIVDQIEKLQLIPRQILATHGHFDHIMAGFALQHTYPVEFWIHENDSFLVKRMHETAQHFLGSLPVDPPPLIQKTLKDGDQVLFGEVMLTVLSSPGHTPGGVSYYAEDHSVMFVGDSLFQGGSIGRTDFSYSSPEDLGRTIEKILTSPSEVILYPGHGEETSIAAEKKFHTDKVVYN